MSSKQVYFLIDLAVHDGKLDEFATTVRSMSAGTAKESGALGYEWFLSNDKSTCRLLETYANTEAVHAHLTGPVVRELVPKLLTYATLKRFEVYGNPDARSAETLSSLGAQIYGHWHGLGSHR